VSIQLPPLLVIAPEFPFGVGTAAPAAKDGWAEMRRGR